LQRRRQQKPFTLHPDEMRGDEMRGDAATANSQEHRQGIEAALHTYIHTYSGGVPPCDLPRGVSSGSSGGGGGGGRRVGQVGGGHKEMQPLRTRWPSVWGPPRALRSEGGAGHFHSEDAADQSGLGSGRTGQPNRSRAEPSRGRQIDIHSPAHQITRCSLHIVGLEDPNIGKGVWW